MEEKLKEIFSAVLNIPLTKINENTSPDTVAGWDSLKQMNLIAAIEEEFNIYFSGDDLLNFLNYKLISLILKERLKESA